ncbi:Crp/Fnr family transcriptional regulator [Actinokineospora sp. NPDC004072]
MLTRPVPRWSPSTLLGRLDEQTRTALLAGRPRLKFEERSCLLRQDDPGDSALVLLSGAVKVYVDSAEGHRSLLGVRLAGDMVGEMAVIEGTGRRSATVQAALPVQAVQLHKAELLELMADHNGFALAVSKMIASRLRWANRRRLDATADRPFVRLSRVLVDLVDHIGKESDGYWELEPKLTQHEIGFMAMLKPRTVEKTLAEMAKRGVVSLGRRPIRVHDRDQLVLWANGAI